eukprot:830269-Alexandrium_andersonii.AAC.1
MAVENLARGLACVAAHAHPAWLPPDFVEGKDASSEARLTLCSPLPLPTIGASPVSHTRCGQRHGRL